MVILLPLEVRLSLLSAYRRANSGTLLRPRWIAFDVDRAPTDLNATVDELVARDRARNPEVACTRRGLHSPAILESAHHAV